MTGRLRRIWLLFDWRKPLQLGVLLAVVGLAISYFLRIAPFLPGPMWLWWAILVLALCGAIVVGAPLVQQNIIWVRSLVVQHPNVSEVHVRNFAEAAYRAFHSSQRDPARSMNEITERYLKWWAVDPSSLYYFCNRRAGGYSDDCSGGFWLIGFDRNAYEELREHRDLVKMADRAVPISDPTCHAIQVVGVVGGDTFFDAYSLQFRGSRFISSRIFESLRAACVKYPHIVKHGNLRRTHERAAATRMTGMWELNATENRRFWEGNASYFRGIH